MRTLFAAISGLILIVACPAETFSQYNPQYENPTNRILDETISTGFKELPLITVNGLIVSQVGLNLKFEYRMGGMKITTQSNSNTVREILEMIDATDGYKVIIREWDVLVVSDVEDKRIQELAEIVKDLEHKNRTVAIDQLLEWSHPSIYPCLFWAMKNDTPEMARKIGMDLLANHSAMMQCSTSFENGLKGFSRVLESESRQCLWPLVNRLPEPILKQFEHDELVAGEGGYLEERVTTAKLTLADMKREYAAAPDSPVAWPMCGTGYVHIMNHHDYAAMIGDLRTKEAYDFLIAQARLLAEIESEKNQQRMAELAMVLAKSDSDAALEIANTIISQQGLDQPADSIVADEVMLRNNAMVGFLATLDRTRQSKYVPVFRAFCNSASAAVRRQAFSILVRRDAKVIEIARKGLDHLGERSRGAESTDEKQAIEQNRFLAAATMSGAKTKAVNEFFLKRLEQPEHAL